MDISILQASPSLLTKTKGEGFYDYNDEQQQLFAFYWTDKSGTPILVSKYYQTAKSRKRVLSRVLKGEYPVQLTTNEEGQPTVAIFNKAKQMIATSHAFENQEVGELARRNVLQTIKVKPSGKAKPKSSTLPADLAVIPGQSTRHSFRLVFYRSSDAKDWQGVLSYPLSEEKVALSGVDGKQITTFIQARLAKPAAEAIAGNRNRPEGISVNWPKVQSINSGQPLTVDWTAQCLDRGSCYEASITAKSLSDGEQTLISRKQFQGDSDQNEFSLTALTAGLIPGMYRLTARLDWVQSETNETLAKDSHLLFLV